MSSLQHMQFSADPSDYLVCYRDDTGKDISCVIVEDTPGPYMDFIQDIVQDGTCRMAMTAPFSDQTLRLLQGHEVTFGSGDSTAKVRIPNLAHCVVILDMRNGDSQSTVQNFQGYDPKDFELAGFHFYNQMCGFPGKPFIATRYGRAHLEEKGISGFFGIVSLEMKADFTGMMPEREKRDLKVALDLALVGCKTSQLCRMLSRGGSIEITLKGEICTPPASQGLLAFMEVIKAGPDGITDADLAKRIHYRPRSSGKDASCETENDKAESPSENPEMTAAELLARLVRVLKKGQIEGLTYASVCRDLGGDVEKTNPDAAPEVLRAVFSLASQANKKFSYKKYSALLLDEPDTRFDNKMGTGEWSTSSVFGEKGPPEIISGEDKRKCKESYAVLHYIEIPRRQAVIEDLKAAHARANAAALRGVAETAEGKMNEEAQERKRNLSGAKSEQKTQLERLEAEVYELGKVRDEYFRLGFKSYPLKNEDGTQIVGFQVPSKMSSVADYMSRLPKRAVADIRQNCSPEPISLIEHIHASWIRENGVHTYKGGIVWLLD